MSKIGTAYLGIGAGLDHVLDPMLDAATQAIAIFGFEVVRCPPPALCGSPAAAEAIRRAMLACDTLYLPLTTPNLSKRAPSERQGVVSAWELEYTIACELRSPYDSSSGALTNAQFGGRPDARVRILLPQGPAAECVGIPTPLTTGPVTRCRVDAERSHGEQDRIASPADLKLQILTHLVRTQPRLASATVMLSGSLEDLKLERGAAEAALKQLGYTPLQFERSATEDEKFRASLDFVHRCTAFLGILYVSYGAVVHSGKSLTQLEYEEAIRLGKMRYFLLRDPEVNATQSALHVLAQQTDEQRSKLDALKHLAMAEEHRKPTDLESVSLSVVEMMSWMARPYVDQQAWPPPKFPKFYEAFPYSLLDAESPIPRPAALRDLDDWLGDPEAPRHFVLDADGGVGKSALTWTWAQSVRQRPKPPHTAWWSFYGRDATASAMATHLCQWLTGEPYRAAGGNPRGPFEALIAQIDRTSGSFLLVLDGIERELLFYRKLEASKGMEGVLLKALLDRLVDEMAERLHISHDRARRDLLSFADAEPTGESAGDESPLAWFLEELSKRSDVRVLLTTRLVPTVMTDLAAKNSDARNGARIRHMDGFSVEQVRALWESKSLAWEDARLPPELGGFSLPELCATLQGSALPVTLLAMLVHAGGGSFQAWKASLDRWRREDDWTQPSGDGQTSATERATNILLDLTMRGLSGAERVVLDAIVASKSAIPHSQLIIDLVGRHPEVPSHEVMHRTLKSLRSRKIIGCDHRNFCYEVHPVLRGASLRSGPDDSPTVQGWVLGIRAKWSKDASGLNESKLPLAFVARRVDDIADVLAAGAARLAHELFRTGIDPILRFRTDGEVVQYRRTILANLGSLADRVAASHSSLASPEGQAEVERLLRPLRLSLAARRADTEMLAGNLSQMRSILEAARFTAEQPDRINCYVWLEWAELLQADGRWEDAWTAYSKALEGSRDTAGPEASGEEADVLRWSYCALIRMMIGRGEAEPACPVFDVLTSVYPDDPDVLSVGVALAAAVGRGVPEALAAHRASVAGRLVLGEVTTELASLRMEARGLIPPGETRFADRCARLRAEAVGHGFAWVLPELVVVLAERQLRDGEPKAALATLDANPTRPAPECDASLYVECQLLRGSACLRLGDRGPAMRHLEEALRAGGAGSSSCAVIDAYERCRDLFAGLDAELRIKEARIAQSAPKVPAIGRAPGARAHGVFTNVEGWTLPDVRAAVEATKARIDWNNTTGSAQKWWAAFESENQHRWALVLRLAEELEDRKATITEFFLAYVYSNTDNIQGNLHYLDFTRLKKAEERRRKEAEARRSASTLEASESRDGDAVDTSIHAGFEKPVPRAATWSDPFPQDSRWVTVDPSTPEFKSRLKAAKATLAWANTKGVARKWWVAFEADNQNRQGVVLRLAEELVARKATITEFYLANVYSNTEHLLANLHYLDYTRLKKEEERKKKEATARAKAEEGGGPPPGSGSAPIPS